MKILVTGGNGFIGNHVSAGLKTYGYTPVVFDRVATPAPYYETFLGDIRDKNAVSEALSHVDGFIHLAGILGTQETIINPGPSVETNVLGGLNILEGSVEHDIPGVNIAVGNFWMNNPYSISKSAVERFVEMYRKERKARINIVRAYNAYGPGQVPPWPYGSSRVRKIMPSFICRALDGKPIQVYGNGEQVMDMIHVRDVAFVLIRALEYTMERGNANTVFEAGTGRATTVLQVAQEVARYTNAKIEHLPMRPGEPERSVVLGNPDTLKPLFEKTEADFIMLEEGVAETVEWYRARNGSLL